MKQGDGKSGRETGDNKDNEKRGGELGDNLLGRYEMCSEEPEDLDDTITNENVSEFLMTQLGEMPLNVLCVGEDLKVELNGLDVTEQSFKDGTNASERFEMGSVNTTDPSHKLNSVDLVTLKGGAVINCKEMEICLLDDDATEKLHNNGNKTEGNTTELLNMTVIENADFRVVGTSSKLIGDGSDSGVEVNGCVSLGGRASSPALLRAFSSNSGGYTSSCGGLEDSLTASTATPAASCDSSLISCYSTYEETEDIVTSTTMMLPADGDGTSEGGSESSSVASKDIRNGKNGTSKRVMTGAIRASAKKRTPATEAAKSNSSSLISKARRASLTATPVNSLRPSSQHQTPATTKTPSVTVGTSTTMRTSVTNSAPHKREKVPAAISTSCGTTIKSGSQKSSTSGNSVKSSQSVTKSLCGSVIGVMKGRSKDSSLSSGSEGRRDVVSASTPGKGRGTRSSSSTRSKVLGGTDDGRWPSSANKSHSSTPKSRGGSVLDGQPRKLNVSGSSSMVSSSLMESKATALEKYATLPRRRRCKSPEVQTTLETSVRSHSVSRDPSLNRAASLRKQHHQREGSSLNKSLPPYPRRRYRTRTVIYHEASSQTALTISDVERALAGVAIKELEPHDAIETQDQEVQASILCLNIIQFYIHL